MRQLHLILVLLYFITPFPSGQAALQGCGVVNSPDLLGYPVDRNDFYNINPFGRPSGRFNGQLHAADDWVLSNGSSLGQPVQAIAPGRVTYANPNGWGRDGGVVIVEHLLPDGSVFYSLYGHMEERAAYPFPARGSCVEKGDYVGVITDPRPAPHLHLEIRNFGPTSPGSGYSEIDPTLLGWYNPSQFIDNWRAWLHPAHRWHINVGDELGLTPSPILRDDGLLLLVDNQYLKIYDSDGQPFRQHRLADSVEIVGWSSLNEDTVVVAAADGRLQYWNPFTGLEDQWETGLELIAEGPIISSDLVVVMDDAETLHVFDVTTRQAVTTYAVSPLQGHAVADHMIAILTRERLLLIQPDGTLEQDVEIRPNSDIIASPDGGFFLRNQSELIHIQPDGEWRTIREGLSANRSDATMIFDEQNGHIILWGIDRLNRLMAVALNGDIVWRTDIHQRNLYGLSKVVLTLPDRCTVVMASGRGYILSLDASTGKLNNQMHVWGQHRTNTWIDSQDGLVRAQIVDQIIALNGSYCQGSS